MSLGTSYNPMKKVGLSRTNSYRILTGHRAPSFAHARESLPAHDVISLQMVLSIFLDMSTHTALSTRQHA